MSAKPPSIGTLRDRVLLQRKDMVSDSAGGQSPVFVPIATVWGRVHQIARSQSEAADARAVATTHTLVIRFRTDLQTGDRATYRGRALEILSVDDLNGRRAYLTCKCREIRVAG